MQIICSSEVYRWHAWTLTRKQNISAAFRGKEEVKMTSWQRSYVIPKEAIHPYV